MPGTVVVADAARLASANSTEETRHHTGASIIARQTRVATQMAAARGGEPPTILVPPSALPGLGARAGAR